MCDMVRLELLYSARNAGEFAAIRDELAAMPDRPFGKARWGWALWVYGQLSAQGAAHQRSVKHADLLIATPPRRLASPSCTTTRTTTASPGHRSGHTLARSQEQPAMSRPDTPAFVSTLAGVCLCRGRRRRGGEQTELERDRGRAESSGQGTVRGAPARPPPARISSG